MTRAPSFTMSAFGSRKTRFFLLQYKSWNRLAMSLVNSKCWRWSSPTGTNVVWYNNMSDAIKTG